MPTIGLDLGRKRFRAVEIEKEKDFYVLKNYGSYDGPELSLNFSSDDQLNNYVAELKKFIREHAFTTAQTIVSLPEQDVFIRVIKTPVMNAKELRNFISLGAEEYIPIPLAEVTFSAQIINTPATAKKSKTLPIFGHKVLQPTAKSPILSKMTDESMTVLLVASKNEVLSKYVSFLKKADLVPKGIEPETLSIERVLGDTEDRPNACIIVSVGSLSTQIIVSYKGFVRFTRSLPVGGDNLTQAVQKELNLDYIQAEEYKKAYGLDETQVEGKVFSAIKPVFDQILLEINRSKMYYTTHNPDVIINRVILSGGTALMPGLLLYIANKLDVEAELANPWRNIKIADNLKTKRTELMDAGPVYTTAVGLALKEI